MAYTIVGMFPANENADNAANQLDHSGFSKDDYTITRHTTTETEVKNLNTAEEEKTTGFWNWLFGDEENERERYSYAGTKSNLLTVYANDMEQAEKARDIMNDHGAIDVNEFTKDRFETQIHNTGTDISERERARIISKAKNNLYLSGNSRVVTEGDKGMSNDMDHQGTNDTF